MNTNTIQLNHLITYWLYILELNKKIHSEPIKIIYGDILSGSHIKHYIRGNGNILLLHSDNKKLLFWLYKTMSGVSYLLICNVSDNIKTLLKKENKHYIEHVCKYSLLFTEVFNLIQDKQLQTQFGFTTYIQNRNDRYIKKTYPHLYSLNTKVKAYFLLTKFK